MRMGVIQSSRQTASRRPGTPDRRRPVVLNRIVSQSCTTTRYSSGGVAERIPPIAHACQREPGVHPPYSTTLMPIGSHPMIAFVACHSLQIGAGAAALNPKAASSNLLDSEIIGPNSSQNLRNAHGSGPTTARRIEHGSRSIPARWGHSVPELFWPSQQAGSILDHASRASVRSPLLWYAK